MNGRAPSRRTSLLAALLAALSALLALGLGASPAPAQSDTLTLGMTLEPPHLDPTAGAAAAIDEIVYQNVFQGLTRIDRDGRVQPSLATGWSVSEDNLVYTFDLAEGVTFHDGTPFDAEDVVFSLDRARAPDSVNAQKQLFESIEAVNALLPRQVEIRLKRPTGNLLYNLAWGDAVIVAPESAETNKSNPIGTGPFRFVRWSRGSEIELERRPDLPAGEGPALAQATFRFIADPAAATAALLAGDVQAFPNFPASESLPVLEADGRFAVVDGTTEGETILAINNARPPFDDVRVRRAIQHAIDREALVKGLFSRGQPIGSHFAPHNPAYVDLTGLAPHDTEAARKELAAASLPKGFKATLKLPPPPYARRGGEIVAAQLAEVGIELELIPIEWAQWLEQVFRGGDYDLTIVSHTEPNDIGIYARPGYYFHYDNPAFNELMDTLDRTVDPSERDALYRRAQEMIAADAVNGFLFQLPKNGVWQKELAGLWENSPIQANDLTEVHWTN